ncbi:MAG: carbon storage regulator CsrA [Fusobacteriota bacterium]
MLVLSRKINESIIIGDDIEIVIVEMKNDQVKLGIKAPRSIPVHRSEVYEEIQLENKKASENQNKLTGLGNLFNKIKNNKKD